MKLKLATAAVLLVFGTLIVMAGVSVYSCQSRTAELKIEMAEVDGQIRQFLVEQYGTLRGKAWAERYCRTCVLGVGCGYCCPHDLHFKQEIEFLEWLEEAGK